MVKTKQQNQCQKCQETYSTTHRLRNHSCKPWKKYFVQLKISGIHNIWKCKYCPFQNRSDRLQHECSRYIKKEESVTEQLDDKIFLRKIQDSSIKQVTGMKKKNRFQPSDFMKMIDKLVSLAIMKVYGKWQVVSEGKQWKTIKSKENIHIIKNVLFQKFKFLKQYDFEANLCIQFLGLAKKQTLTLKRQVMEELVKVFWERLNESKERKESYLQWMEAPISKELMRKPRKTGYTKKLVNDPSFKKKKARLCERKYQIRKSTFSYLQRKRKRGPKQSTKDMIHTKIMRIKRQNEIYRRQVLFTSLPPKGHEAEYRRKRQRQVNKFALERALNYATASSVVERYMFLQEGGDLADEICWNCNLNSQFIPIPKFLLEKDEQVIDEMMERQVETKKGKTKNGWQCYKSEALPWKQELYERNLIIQDDERIKNLYDSLFSEESRKYKEFLKELRQKCLKQQQQEEEARKRQQERKEKLKNGSNEEKVSELTKIIQGKWLLNLKESMQKIKLKCWEKSFPQGFFGEDSLEKRQVEKDNKMEEEEQEEEENMIMEEEIMDDSDLNRKGK